MKQPAKLLSMVLVLTALHSFIMGLMLIIQPSSFMKMVGFNPICQHFFPAQGGVFHVLMGIAYFMGAVNRVKYHPMIVFAIIVKTGATLFLMIYCFAVEFKWIILLSGIGDLIMALAILMALKNYLCYREDYRQQAYI